MHCVSSRLGRAVPKASGVQGIRAATALLNGHRVHTQPRRNFSLVDKETWHNADPMNFFQYKTMPDGSEWPWMAMGTWEVSPEQMQDSAFAHWEQGFRIVDCAPIYGNQKAVGDAWKAYQDHRVDTIREEFKFVSKIWNTEHHPADVQRSAERSIKDLQCEYLDLLLIHWPCAWQRGSDPFPLDDNGNYKQADLPLLETWAAMEKLVKSGLVKNIGVSNFNQAELNIVLKSDTKPLVNQIECHPYLPQRQLTKFMEENDVAVMAYSPMASVDFESRSHMYTPGEPISQDQQGDRHLPRLLDDKRVQLMSFYAGQLRDQYSSPGGVLLRYQIDRGHIPIVRSTNPDHIQMNWEDVWKWTMLDYQIPLLEKIGRQRQINPTNFREPFGKPFFDDSIEFAEDETSRWNMDEEWTLNE